MPEIRRYRQERLRRLSAERALLILALVAPRSPSGRDLVGEGHGDHIGLFAQKQPGLN